MNMRYIRLLFALLSAGAFMSCEVEFSPNAEWKETPVVYCLLDQDDSLSWVRVERCYLSEGEIYGGASVSDSFNYPDGALQVAVLAFNDGRQVDSIPFQYMLVDREDGNFANTLQPVYCGVTYRRLKDAYTYELRIRRTSDGSMLASASTTLVTPNDGTVLIKPNNSAAFGFSTTRYCDIEWYAMRNARYYQPVVRFYYSYKYLGDDTLFVDLPCSPRLCIPPYSRTYSIRYSRDAFLTVLREHFAGDTNTKVYPKIFDIYINACNEELYAYLSSESSAGGVDQNHMVYSNIDGGLGVFAARRTHLYRRVPGDDSDRPGVGLHALLKDSIGCFL